MTLFNILQITAVRYKQKKYPKVDKKFQAAAESLAARGYSIKCLQLCPIKIIDHIES